MTEKKVVYQATVSSLPTLKMVLGDVPTPNPKRGGRLQAGSKNKHGGIEMETIVTKLITHFKKNHK